MAAARGSVMDECARPGCTEQVTRRAHRHCSLDCRRRNVWCRPSKARTERAVLAAARATWERMRGSLWRPCKACGVPVYVAELKTRQHRRCRDCESARNLVYMRAYRARQQVPRLPDGVTFVGLRDAQGNRCADCGQRESTPRARSRTGQPQPLSIHWENRGTNPRLVCLACLFAE
jgi:hypothetical protein